MTRRNQGLEVENLEAFCEWDTRVPELRERLQGMNKIPEQMVQPSLRRIRELGEALQAYIYGRDQCVWLTLAACIARVPVVLFGPPGTAKSMLVRKMAELCTENAKDGVYFEYLITQHTMPEELFGVPMIDKLKEGRIERNIERMLPTASFVFLDEVFRGGSHILNTLLAIMNERIFHDGARRIPVPLVNVIGAANRPPADEELDAFYDRFPVRIWVDSVFASTEGGRSGGLVTACELLKREQRYEQRDRTVPRKACISDFVLLQEHLLQAPMNPDNDENLQSLVVTYLTCRDVCRLSDRSLFAFARFARAHAALRGEGSERRRYLEVLACAARTERQKRGIEQAVASEISAPRHVSEA